MFNFQNIVLNIMASRFTIYFINQISDFIYQISYIIWRNKIIIYLDLTLPTGMLAIVIYMQSYHLNKESCQPSLGISDNIRISCTFAFIMK